MKKIMFNDMYGLTKAVLEGKKTMTRRLLPLKTVLKYGVNDRSVIHKQEDLRRDSTYKPGEVVAVARNYRSLLDGEFLSAAQEEEVRKAVGSGHKGCTNKMFVKPELMPNLIRITDIKVERLQSISDEDCLKECVQMSEHKVMKGYYPSPSHVEAMHKVGWGRVYHTPQEAFAELIDRVSGEGVWDRNPWVYVYEFELLKKEDNK